MEPVTIALIAGAAMKVIGPYLANFATKAGESLAAKSADGAVAGALSGAKRLLGLIRSKFAGNSQAEASLGYLEANPDDEQAQAAVTRHLENAMVADPQFASSIESELAQISNTNADIAFVNNIQGDVGKIVQIETVHGDVTF
ncbi:MULTISPECIES: hypothetical protein [Nocardia]|uniref:hypothetical protein n=1 Tax=Nocardia sp. NPDC057272 TaxID=3346079 RepID=UPI0036262ABC